MSTSDERPAVKTYRVRYEHTWRLPAGWRVYDGRRVVSIPFKHREQAERCREVLLYADQRWPELAA